jgi:putative ABC transport system substrate-binding protein
VKRRAFIAGLGSAAAWPVVAQAQQPAIPVIGFLNSGSRDGYVPMVAAFRQGLKETGYIEDRNVAVEYRWAEGQYDGVPAMAPELVRRQVALIVANSPGVMTVKAATTTIPIVRHSARRGHPAPLVPPLPEVSCGPREASVRIGYLSSPPMALRAPG